MALSFSHLLLEAVARVHVRSQLKGFLRATRKAALVQERTLLEKIKRNAASDFGRDHDFSRIRTYADFIAAVPVQSYENHKPYIRRVMEGQTGALFGPSESVLMFALTSGSTNEPKHIPITPTFAKEYRRGWHIFGIKALLDHPQAFFKRIVQTASSMEEYRTPGGIPCGSISGLLASNQKKVVHKYYTTPASTAQIADPDARYYTIMRHAIPNDVGWMVTANPATQVKLASIAADHAEQLIRDIYDGTLTPPGQIPADVSCELESLLQPNALRAKQLETLLAQHGQLLPKHYWNLGFLANWTGGTLSLHLRDFPHYFGDTPVRDIGLLATEGRMSIPMQDNDAHGVLDITGSFFEFLDIDSKSDDPLPVCRCHEVQVGRTYRILMTTSSGLYRYDIGDHVLVHGFEGQAPIIEFLHRGSRVSSITGEKITEWQVTQAFTRTCAQLGLPSDHFVLAPVWGQPPFYRLHLQLSVERATGFAKTFDDELRSLNIEYDSKRKSQRLGEIVTHHVSQEIIDKPKASTRTANEQYKHQFLYTNPGEDEAFITELQQGEQLA